MAQLNTGAAGPARATLVQVGLNLVATLAFAVSALTRYDRIGYLLGGVTLAGLAVLAARRGPGGYVTAQILLLGGFLVDFDRQPHSRVSDDLLIATGLVTMAMLLNQATVKRMTGRRIAQVAHLPGAEVSMTPLVPPPLLSAASTALVALVGLSAALTAPAWPVAALALLVAVATLATMATTRGRYRRAHLVPGVLRAAVEHYRPEFVLYYSAPMGSEYHVQMWLPYLERIGRPYIVVLRESAAFELVAPMTGRPVIVCRSVAEVDNLVVPSMRAVFYVNNGMKNAHMVRFHQLVHVQMLHGDSDKASSYNPVTAMFDRVYVAGPAAIDRYATHGVHIDPDKFVVVGRPQVESITVATQAGTGERTVMYATTWSGLFADADYNSLGEHGETIVRELLARGVRVIFRPHPLTHRSAELTGAAGRIEAMLVADRAKTGRRHLHGPAAHTALSLFECFNLADALITDVSGVASDFLYSEKPLALTDMGGDGPRFAATFPLARAAYVLHQDASNVRPVIDDLLGPDPLQATRRAMKRDYLGDFPADTYADAFVRAARADIEDAGHRVGDAGRQPAVVTAIAG